MEKQVTALGIIFVIFHFLIFLIGLAILLTFAGVGILSAMALNHFSHLPVSILMGIGGLIGGIFMVISLPGIIAGAGLIRFKSWARVLALIISFFQLINFPIGTALGIYSFVILLSPKSVNVFK
jgi:hypothetical protein